MMFCHKLKSYLLEYGDIPVSKVLIMQTSCKLSLIPSTHIKLGAVSCPVILALGK